MCGDYSTYSPHYLWSVGDSNPRLPYQYGALPVAVFIPAYANRPSVSSRTPLTHPIVSSVMYSRAGGLLTEYVLDTLPMSMV